jgi:hypothetical protein
VAKHVSKSKTGLKTAKKTFEKVIRGKVSFIKKIMNRKYIGLLDPLPPTVTPNQALYISA